MCESKLKLLIMEGSCFFCIFFPYSPWKELYDLTRVYFQPHRWMHALFAEHAVVSQDLRRLLQISPRETAFRVYMWLEDGELSRTAVL